MQDTIIYIIKDLNCVLLLHLLQDDDSYILPVLLRFDGQPEVDEQVCTKFQDFKVFLKKINNNNNKNYITVQGNILYRFPSLQRTGGRKEYVGRKWNEFVGGVDKFFKEKKWDFRSFF